MATHIIQHTGYAGNPVTRDVDAPSQNQHLQNLGKIIYNFTQPDAVASSATVLNDDDRLLEGSYHPPTPLDVPGSTAQPVARLEQDFSSGTYHGNITYGPRVKLMPTPWDAYPSVLANTEDSVTIGYSVTPSAVSLYTGPIWLFVSSAGFVKRNAETPQYGHQVPSLCWAQSRSDGPSSSGSVSSTFGGFRTGWLNTPIPFDDNKVFRTGERYFASMYLSAFSSFPYNRVTFGGNFSVFSYPSIPISWIQ